MTDITIADANVGWYAILTPPQREQRVVNWLKQFGVYSFYPVEKKWRTRRVTRKTCSAKPTHNGRQGYFHERTILPGYVFSKFSGTPRWHILRQMPNITGVLGHMGHPIRIKYNDLQTLHELRHRQAELDTQAEAAAQVIFKPGDEVQVTDGIAMGSFVREVTGSNPSKEIAYLRDLSILGCPLPVPYSSLARV